MLNFRKGEPCTKRLGSPHLGWDKKITGSLTDRLFGQDFLSSTVFTQAPFSADGARQYVAKQNWR
jgi:hypothetical protein